MFEKLLPLLLQGKGLVVAGTLATGMVVTGTVGTVVAIDRPTLGEDVVVSQDPGNGCGWIAGEARGDAVQALQSGWLGFHQLAMGYNGNIGSADFDKRRELITEVQSTREGLHEIRMEALMAIHAKAKEYLELCLNGTLSTLDGQTFVTVEQDVVDTSHLLYEYRSIVDKAMVDMQEFYYEAKTNLETLSTSTGATPGGKPEGAGPPEGAGKPEGAGPPEGAGKPEEAGKP